MTPRTAWLVAALAAGCSAPPPPLSPPEPPVVTVEHPVERTLDSFAEFTGWLDAVERQQVRAQVTGYLKEVKFKDGDYVKEGQELFLIDPVPYQAALDSAKAQLAKTIADEASAQAQLVNAEKDYERSKTLSGVSKQELDKYISARDSAVATKGAATAAVSAAKAALEKAEFDRQNCTVRSEVKGVGRTSRTQVTPGNLVTTRQTVLCTVTSLNPVYAYWVVDELTSLEYRKTIFDKKELPDPRDPKGPGLKCVVGQKDDNRFPYAGVVDYVAPEINRSTGTREIRATIPNPAPYKLGPGDSIRVRVESGAARKAITVPEVAVGSQQRQKYVYVIGKNEKGEEVAEFRPVTLGPVREVDGVRLQMIDSGLTSADRVVVNGLLRVRPGVPVKTVTSGATSASAKP
ncbi:MAG: efflux RND transporter periplasmic adaptor subunit [Gemmataceae bacterium]